MPDVDCKRAQVRNQGDGSLSWGKDVGSIADQFTAASTVSFWTTHSYHSCFHSMLPQYAFTVITAASTCDTMNGDPLPVALFQEDTRANPSPHSDPTLGLYANWKI